MFFENLFEKFPSFDVKMTPPVGMVSQGSDSITVSINGTKYLGKDDENCGKLFLYIVLLHYFWLFFHKFVEIFCFASVKSPDEIRPTVESVREKLNVLCFFVRTVQHFESMFNGINLPSF